MTLEELDKASPAGLDNAQIRSLVRDHYAARLTIRVKIVVGPSTDGSGQPQYREGEICFHGVQYFVSETASAESAFRDCNCASFTFTRTEPSILPEPILSIRSMQSIDKYLPPETLRYSLSIQNPQTTDWHAKVNIAAREVSFNWSSLKR